MQNYCFKLLKLVSLKEKNKKSAKKCTFFEKSAFFSLVDALWAMGRADGAIGYGLLAIDLLTVHLVCLLSFFAENLN